MREKTTLIFFLFFVLFTVIVHSQETALNVTAWPEADVAGAWNTTDFELSWFVPSRNTSENSLVYQANMTYWHVRGLAQSWIALGLDAPCDTMQGDAWVFWVDESAPNRTSADIFMRGTDTPPSDSKLGGTQNIQNVNCSSISYLGDKWIDCTFERAINTGDVYDTDFTEWLLNVDFADGCLTYAMLDSGSHPRLTDTDGLRSFNQHSSASKVDFNFYTGVVEDEGFRRDHGWLMVFAWGVCGVLASMVPRYLRVGNPWLWFIFHTCSAGLAVILNIAGFALVVANAGGDFGADPHTGLGLAVFIMGIIQPILGLVSHFTYDPERERKSIPDWIHQIFGWCLLCCAIAAIYTGFDYYSELSEGIPDWTYGAFSGWLGLCLIVVLFLEIWRLTHDGDLPYKKKE